MATRPPLPPFTRETVIQKGRLKTVGIPGILRKPRRVGDDDFADMVTLLGRVSRISRT